MKISIDNFKTLKSLEEFEFFPFTIITGVNSSGKSSFIQFLLLLKQTLEKPTTNSPLNFDGDIINLGLFEDIIYQKNTENRLSTILSFDNSEFSLPDFGTLKAQSCDVKFSIFGQGDEVFVNTVEFNYYVPDAVTEDHFLKFEIMKMAIR